MRRFRNKTKSIYWRLGGLIVMAMAFSLVFFLLTNMAGRYLIDAFTNSDGYISKEDRKRIISLQEYITGNNLTSYDYEKLASWTKKHPEAAILVYKNGRLVYDSYYSDMNYSGTDYEGADYTEGTTGDQHHWGQLYTVMFSDGSAEVLLWGFYAYQYMNYALTAELIMAFVLFLGIVMIGIRRTIHYIRELGREIKILEGGDLDYPITVQGNDELACLAEGLDSMRQSFRAQTENERHLTKASQRLVVEMSHDLRTPLTSIMLYTEILLKGKYQDKVQMMEYIRKIDRKAKKLKGLSDHLFEYALISSEEEVRLEGPVDFQSAFYDILSETTAYLEQRGFCVVSDFLWEKRSIRINQYYVSRIFDNLTSNIIKYADYMSPVYISTVYTEQSAGFTIRNRKAEEGERVESTKIGLKNIHRMMDQMEAKSGVDQTQEEFLLRLQFSTTMS